MVEEESLKKALSKEPEISSKTSEENMSFPDVCETPSPAGPIPIPYPNIAKSSDTAKGTKTVKMDGKEVTLKDSSYTKSTGDEPSHGSGTEKIDTEKISQLGTIKRLMNVKKLGVPIWIWSLIITAGLLIILILSSNVRPPIEPYEPLH